MQMSRRYFLKTTGAVAAYLGASEMESLLLAAEPGAAAPAVTPGKTLVVLFLRGGADGLNLVVPHGDPHYRSLRQHLAIAGPKDASVDRAERAIDLDGQFGLHPRLSALAPLFQQKLALAAHAVGYDQNTRSHFEEQDVWETGVIGNTVNSDGWVNRHLLTSSGHGLLRAVSIGDTLPRILHGKAPAYAIRGLEDLTLPQGRAKEDAVVAALEHAYCQRPSEPRVAANAARDLLSQTTQATLEGVRQLRSVAKQPYSPAVPYPETELGAKLKQVARLIKANLGVEVAEVDLGGWDTHQDQGQNGGGTFGYLAQQVGDALAAFTQDLGDRMRDVLVVTLTDFGRTAAVNGTNGTDHGWANCMFLLGGPVQVARQRAEKSGRPRPVMTRWPGLAPDQLHEGRDLSHTTDFRDVLAELVRVHLGNAQMEKVLPSHVVKPVGLIA